jgi:DnaJ-class molecular chaperone
VQRRFREMLRDIHPDHGAETAGAADRIAEITEARRILLAR